MSETEVKKEPTLQELYSHLEARVAELRPAIDNFIAKRIPGIDAKEEFGITEKQLEDRLRDKIKPKVKDINDAWNELKTKLKTVDKSIS